MSIKSDVLDFQMGLPVYSSDNEKVGILRFTLTSPLPPYQVQQLAVDRTDGADGAVCVDIQHTEPSDKQEIRLNISSEEFGQLPIFVENSWPSGGRERDGRGMAPRSQGPRGGKRRPDRGRGYQPHSQRRSGMM